MTPKVFLLSVVSCLVVPLGSRASAASDAPALLFRASFDGTSKPEYAAGSDELLPSGRVTFVPGHKGQAMKPLVETKGFRRLIGGGLQYAGEGNLDFDRGSVAFWWRTDFDSSDRSKPSIQPGRMPVQAPITNHVPFYVFEYFNELRFFLGDQSCKGAIPEWHKAEWHFVAATWDHTEGLHLYADGKLVAESKATWGHYPFPDWIRLGIQKDAYDIEGLLDEFMIFNRPLSAPQVVDLMNDRLSLQDAPRFRKPAAARAPNEGVRADARVAWQASFEEGETLAVSASNHVDLVDGLIGKALRTHPDSRFSLRIPGVLDRKRGAISFWFRPEWQFETDDKSLFLVSTGGPSAPLAIWQQIYRMGVIYQFRAGTQPVLSAYNTQAREWYFVTMSWDDGRVCSLSLDGRYELQPSVGTIGGVSSAAPVDTLWLGSAAGENAADATFDELQIWDGPLTRQQILAEVDRHKPLQMFITLKVQDPGKPFRPTLLFYNRLGRTQPLDGEFKVIDPSGKVAFTGRYPRSKAAGRSWTKLAFDPKLTSSPGAWIVRYHPGPNLAEVGDYVYVPGETGIPPVKSETEQAGSLFYPERGTLVDEIDCGAPLSPERVVTDKFCRVVDSPLGRYLETGAPRLSRFAVRLKVTHPETLHYLALEVPDDKERVCLINNVRWRDNLNTGYLAGGEYRNTGKLAELVVPVYPHETDLAFTLMNQQANKPCALKRARLYEAAPIAAAGPLLPDRLPHRLMGEHYEQTEIETFFTDAPRWGMYSLPPENSYRAWDRYTAFLASTGQNLVDLPYGWYDGLSYPSATEEFLNPCGRGIWYLMELASRRGLKVIPQLTFRQAYPLTLAAREFHGQPYDNPILQVAWDGSTVTTPTWGVPMFNPLHPTVQAVFRRQVEDLMMQYGKEPALGGVALVGSGWASTWFVDLSRDYSDYTVGLFERETGIRVPTAQGRQRFAARFEFLADDAHRAAWVGWRCRKIKEFYDSLGAVIQRSRPDLKLYASVYPISDADAEDVILHGASLKEKYREAGIDPDLFKDDRKAVVRFEYNIDVVPSMRAGTDFSPIPFLPMRDLEYLPEGFSSLAAGKERAFTLHRLYFENYAEWGMAKEAPDLPGLWIQDRMHLPSWQSGLCNTPATLGRSFLKQLALDVANNDPFLIEHGGIWPIVGHEKELREFAMAFLALPALRFQDFPGMEDPVRLRTLQANGKFYSYLVNREPYVVRVEVALQKPARNLSDLVTKKRIETTDGRVFSLTLDAYQLVSFASNGANRILRAQAIVPEEEKMHLQQRLAELKRVLDREAKDRPEHALAAETVARMEREFGDGHYSVVRLLGEGAVARRLIERNAP